MTEQLVFDVFARTARAETSFSRLGAVVAGAAGSVGDLAGRLDRLNGRVATARVALAGNKEAQAQLDAYQAKLVSLNRRVTSNISEVGAARATAEISAMDVALDKLDAKNAAAATGLAAVGAAAAAAGVRTTGFGTGLGVLRAKVALFGGALGALPLVGAVTGLHLIADAVVETTAVVVPAAIAFGAFGAAAIPTVKDLYGQFKNLLTVQTAVGHAIPPLTGGFEKMADAVKPQVYSLLGAGLSVINSKTGEFAGLATGAGTVLTRLAARAQIALGSSGMSKFLASAVTDLAKIGDVAANIFGIAGNLLKTMPGYAEKLLSVLDAVSHGLEVITGSPVTQGLIHAGLAMHGFALYAGLAATGVSLLAPVLARSATWAVGLQKSATATGNLAANASRIDKTKAAFADFGHVISGTQVAVVKTADGTAKLGSEAARGAGLFARFGGAVVGLITNPWTWAVVGAAAIGFLAFKILTARDATRKWADSLQATIDRQTSFRQVISATESVIGKVGVAYRGAQSSVKILQKSSDTFGATQAQLNQRLAEAHQTVNDLTPAQKSYNAELVTEHGRLGQLVAMFGSQAKAQQVANAVHIKASKLLTESGALYKQDITAMGNYELAVKAVAEAMGRSGTARYNAALNALNNTFLTGTLPAIQQVTAAEDTLTNTILGGRQGFTGFETVLQKVGKDAQASGAHLSGLGKNSLALAGDFYGPSGAIVSAQKLTDSLQQQDISTKHLTTAVADEVKQMIPFAGKNKEARATLVSLINNALGPGTVSLKSLNKWVGQNSGTLKGFNAIVAQSTIKAGTLASTLKNQLNAQFRADLLASSGADKALKTYTGDIVHNQDRTAAGKSDRQRLITDLENAGLSAKDARKYVDGLQTSVGKLHGKHVGVDVSGSGTWTVSQLAGGTRRAAAGWRVPGWGGGDKWPALLEGGESVVPKHLTPVVAPFLKAHGVPGFARGVVGSYAGGVPGEGRWAGREYASTVNAIEASVAAATWAAMKRGNIAIVRDAMRWIGKIPYVWGGTAVPGGADCSGFVQTIYGRHGISAPRTSEAQGAWVRRSPPVPGGLAFYTNPQGGTPPGHVAIVGFGGHVISQGGGMGPQYEGLHGPGPLMFTGVPRRGFGGGGRGGNFPIHGGPVELGRSMAAARGWRGAQWSDLFKLWQRESGWNPRARNPGSGAAGIPQDITGNFHGGARGQIAWGLNYIGGRYGSPARAWGHEQRFGWYDRGGYLPPGVSMAFNGTGRPERVLGPAEPATVNYTINVSVPVGANKREAGRDIVDAIREFERGSGKGWRS